MKTFILNIVLIVIIFIFYRYFKYKKLDNKLFLYISDLEFLIRFIVFILFWFIFVFFFRVLNLFRQKSITDLNIIFSEFLKYDIFSMFLLIVVVVFFIKFLIFKFKINFLKIHYYLMNDWNFKYSEIYCDFLYFFVTWPSKFYSFLFRDNIAYKKIMFFLFKYGFEIVLLFLLAFDIFNNNYILLFFCKVLPFFSLYKLIYNINAFLYFNLEFFYDSFITKSLYPLKKSMQSELFDISNNSSELIVIRSYIKKISSI